MRPRFRRAARSELRGRVALFFAGLFFAGVVHAEDCSGGVSLVASPPGTLAPEELAEIALQLRAGLGPSGIQVCDGSTPGDGVALLEVTPNADGSTVLTLSVRDRLTRKRVERAVDLQGFTGAARLFALSVAAEELLAASWAELLLEKETPEVETPVPVRRHVESRLRPTVEGRLRWSIGGRGEVVRLAESRFGFDLALRFFFDEGAHLRLGMSWLESVAQSDQSGVLGATQWAVAFGAGHTWARTSFLEWTAMSALRLGYERLDWRPVVDGFRGVPADQFTLALDVGFGPSLRFGAHQRVELVAHGGPVIVGGAGRSPEGTGVGTADYVLGLGLRGEFVP